MCLSKQTMVLCLTVMAGLFAGGCACTNMDHLATTNWTDRHIVPDDKAGQWLMTPLLIPVTVVTLAADNFIVAPAANLPSAYLDAREWMTHDMGGYYTEMGILPFRVILCPIIFLGSELGRTIFGVEPDTDAAWGWPAWGRQWVRDDNGKLLGPPTEFDPRTKKPVEKKTK